MIIQPLFLHYPAPRGVGLSGWEAKGEGSKGGGGGGVCERGVFRFIACCLGNCDLVICLSAGGIYIYTGFEFLGGGGHCALVVVVVVREFGWDGMG